MTLYGGTVVAWMKAAVLLKHLPVPEMVLTSSTLLGLVTR